MLQRFTIVNLFNVGFAISFLNLLIYRTIYFSLTTEVGF